MKFCYLIILFMGGGIFAQDTIPNFTAIDSLYREDQFYLGLSYNLLQNREQGIQQNKISYGITAGILRDMPINKARNISIAAGLGYSFQNINQNILVSKIGGDFSYTIIDPEDPFTKNKVQTHAIELPVEFRWRTSTAESHKFWRIYTGFKVGYVFYNVAKFNGSQGTFIYKNNPDVNNLQYTVYTALGYNTWNIYVSYGLNPILSDAALNGRSIDLNSLNLGLQFYIL